MSREKDIRWQQRFDNYRKALRLLNDAINLKAKRVLSDLEKQGLIQVFEFTHELSWKTLKDLFKYQGIGTDILGSRDTAREAFKLGLVEDGRVWMAMIESRNLTSHIYDEETVNQIIEVIANDYIEAFNALEKRLSSLVEA